MKTVTNIKDRLILTIVFIILFFSVYNAIDDKLETHKHHEFFDYVTKFVKVGNRYTATTGDIDRENSNFNDVELCDEINKIRFYYQADHSELIDCDKYDTPIMEAIK